MKSWKSILPLAAQTSGSHALYWTASYWISGAAAQISAKDAWRPRRPAAAARSRVEVSEPRSRPGGRAHADESHEPEKTEPEYRDSDSPPA